MNSPRKPDRIFKAPNINCAVYIQEVTTKTGGKFTVGTCKLQRPYKKDKNDDKSWTYTDILNIKDFASLRAIADQWEALHNELKQNEENKVYVEKEAPILDLNNEDDIPF